MPPNFVHLHVLSEYSLLDSTCRIPELVQRAAELGMPALALTDHENLFGAIEFYKECRVAGIKPIIGCEVSLELGRIEDRKANVSMKTKAGLILLARNEIGYRNLMKLVSASHLGGMFNKPHLDKELLTQHAEGLIGISAFRSGGSMRHSLAASVRKGEQLFETFKGVFAPGDFYLGITDQGLPRQRAAVAELLRYAKQFDLKLVATNDVHYVRKDDLAAYDVLHCIRTRSSLAERNRRGHAGPERHLKTSDEMAALFAEVPQALAATLEIAEKCNLKIELGQNRHPDYPSPEGETRAGYLRRLCYEGLERRFGRQARAPDLRQRLNYELGVLEQAGFSSYFLIVWDFIDYAKRHDIPVGPGRGSTAGSLIAYVLGITDLDPLRYGLCFERFFNPERIFPPDIDVDFCYNRRPEVIDYLRRKYGERSIAQIITFGTLGAKMAIRDVGRVMGLSHGEVNRLAKLIPFDAKMTLPKVLHASPEFKCAYNEKESARSVIDSAISLEGIVRHVGVHAAGLVISDRDLTEYTPLTKDDQNRIVAQYPMKALGDIGLVKLDFLGLKILTVIHETLKLIEQATGKRIVPHEIPLDDPKAFELLSGGQNLGLFLMESAGMCKACISVQPRSIEHIIALVALYRPSSMELLPLYISRKSEEVPIEYAHPLLEPVLKETYGILIYQEQFMQAAQILAEYTLGGADALRRDISKRMPEELGRQRAIFIDGAKRKCGIPKKKAEQLFDFLKESAGYAFNKAHAACYGVLACQTAWLKARYPVQFMAAHLSNEVDNPDRIALFVAEAKAMGISILPLGMNPGNGAVAVDGNSIRFDTPNTFSVQVYRLDGNWFMDDPEKEILLEELIRGMPKIIEHLVGKRTDRFTCTFSDRRLHGNSAALEKDHESDEGCWYVLKGTSLRGWLCPTIFRYFNATPEVIYLQWN